MEEFDKIRNVALAFVVFIIPGALFLLLASNNLFMIMGIASNVHDAVNNPIYFLAASYAIGLISYAYWGAIFRMFAALSGQKTLSSKDVQKFNIDDIERIKYTYEHDFRMYQIYGSMSIILLILTFIAWLVDSSIYKAIVLGVSSIFCAVTGAFCYFVFRDRMLGLNDNNSSQEN